MSIPLGLRRRTMLAAIAAGIGCCLASPATIAAVSCEFNSTAGVNFGAYDVFSKQANNNGVGSLTIRCRGGNSPAIRVSLSTGQSGSYAARLMRSGGNALNYNLYTNAARTLVWGDGTGSSGTLTAVGNKTTTLSIFGQIPVGQDASVGLYSDTIVTTVDF